MEVTIQGGLAHCYPVDMAQLDSITRSLTLGWSTPEHSEYILEFMDAHPDAKIEREGTATVIDWTVPEDITVVISLKP